ncbi:hypothetical protein FACS1894217_00900 [Clostridia bacterium]|nr:hypothetical protein FACS1894217_00900 [Clostridia bacterium]
MSKNILAVDDVSTYLQRVSEILSPKYNIMVAKSPEKAIKILQTEQIDLALLDIEMPGLDGFELLTVIRDLPAYTQLPIIFVTSHADKEFIAKAYANKAVNYVLKPYDQTDLKRKIAEALGETEA